jgi:hypothetical protein
MDDGFGKVFSRAVEATNTQALASEVRAVYRKLIKMGLPTRDGAPGGALRRGAINRPLGDY